MSVITRAQMQKKLLPGLKALYGLEYNSYPEQWSKIFDKETSDRSFEQVLKLGGFGLATVKSEGQGVSYLAAGKATPHSTPTRSTPSPSPSPRKLLRTTYTRR